MAARMFDQPFPAETPLVLQQDFGVDLLSHADAEGWLLKRAARCQGNWDRQVYDELMTVLQNP